MQTIRVSHCWMLLGPTLIRYILSLNAPQLHFHLLKKIIILHKKKAGKAYF